ncbi:hypothetical protein P7K49_026048 [Saguinus oedipus]|uniref:Uncharacterized protein n=1 Tax=Saguinus oedipus TaxID=9490 RepID=A0ABQ9UJP8_SAGOE|nr:hypothetical protein P7K49_026048 [Saguinus oedipus]
MAPGEGEAGTALRPWLPPALTTLSQERSATMQTHAVACGPAHTSRLSPHSLMRHPTPASALWSGGVRDQELRVAGKVGASCSVWGESQARPQYGVNALAMSPPSSHVCPRVVWPTALTCQLHRDGAAVLRLLGPRLLHSVTDTDMDTDTDTDTGMDMGTDTDTDMGLSLQEPPTLAAPNPHQVPLTSASHTCRTRPTSAQGRKGQQLQPHSRPFRYSTCSPPCLPLMGASLSLLPSPSLPPPMAVGVSEEAPSR